MNDKLTRLISEAAEQCERDGVAIDGEPGGAILQWVMRNCQYRPGTEFYIVTLIAAEMADRSARREGFKNQFDRAASRILKGGAA